MAAKTIEDYKKDYELAKANGDAAGMQKANDGANALRAASGQQLEYATADINKVANSNTGSVTGNKGSNINYTPANASSGSHIDYDTYVDAVKKQQSYIDKTGSSTPYTTEEYQKLYGDIYAGAKESAPANRTSLVGGSGADEGLLSSGDYAVIQKLKQDFADAQTGYKQAAAAGNTALAAQYQQAMDNAHLAAEKIRAGYNYSGGSDGSMYIDYAVQAAAGNMKQDNTKQTQDLLKSKGLYDEDETVSGGVGGGTAQAGFHGRASSAGGLSVPDGADLTGRVEDYSSYLEQMYAARKQAALAELRAAYEKNLAELERAEAGVGEQYQAARNQTAGASEQFKRNYAQYAAANGLNSGTAGQAELARNVTLQNDLTSINTAEADTIAQLRLQRANAETEYNAAIAQAQAQGDYELASALYQEKVRVQEALIEAEIVQQQYALQKYQLQYQALRDSVEDGQWVQELEQKSQQSADELAFQQQKYAASLIQSQKEAEDKLAQDRREALAAYGKTYLSMGVMPSEAMLEAMGITQAEAQEYITAVRAKAK